MGHINTIGSLDRTSLSPKAVGSGGAVIGEVSCRSMATLSRLAPYGGEAPPPYEWTLSLSVEEVVSTGWMDGWIDGQTDGWMDRWPIYMWSFPGSGSRRAPGGERT